MKKFAAFVTGAVALLSVAAFSTAGRDRAMVGVTSGALYVKSAKSVAPTTVDGYRLMFSKVDENIWGAADVSLSVTMKDGRRVWLYGDTLSRSRGMVNSTALVQLGGYLHVSNQGRQLLPTINSTDGRKHVYWIEGARAVGPTTLVVSAGEHWVTNLNGLGFGRVDETYNKLALLELDAANNVHFVRWVGQEKRPVLDTHFLEKWEGGDGVPGHLFYNKQVHNDIMLNNGKPLITICQNRAETVYTKDGLIDYNAYRVVFTS